MKETRYAVLVGMNNYKKNPLSYSVKDVIDVKNALIEYCKFEDGNIFTITESKEPVIYQIENAFKEIESRFQRGSDLLLFYYSGHGDYDHEEEKSILYFADETSLGIGDVLMNYFQPLNAKNHYLIIDACHSGKNIYVKTKHNARKMERKLLNDSKELYFLFAAEENKKAFQNDKLENSYYTYYFVNAIKNKKLYDDDGFLTINAIDEYIRKQIVRHKDVIQIPGSESRSTGYKPFAFLNNTIEKINNQDTTTRKKENMETTKPENMESSTSKFDLEQSITRENRENIQSKLKMLLETEVGSFDMGDLKDKYEIDVSIRHLNIYHDLEHELEKAIITRARTNDLNAINDLFTIKLIKQNRKRTGLTAMFDMLHGEPEPEYSYDIKYSDSYIAPAFIQLKAKSFQDVSGGLYCLFYQTKYGFVFCKTFFKYVWDGTHEKISTFVKVDLTPYRLVEENVDESRKELILSLQELTDNIKKWNTERTSEIAAFLKKAK